MTHYPDSPNFSMSEADVPANISQRVHAEYLFANYTFKFPHRLICQSVRLDRNTQEIYNNATKHANRRALCLIANGLTVTGQLPVPPVKLLIVDQFIQNLKYANNNAKFLVLAEFSQQIIQAQSIFRNCYIMPATQNQTKRRSLQWKKNKTDFDILIEHYPNFLDADYKFSRPDIHVVLPNTPTDLTMLEKILDHIYALDIHRQTNIIILAARYTIEENIPGLEFH